MFDIPNRTIIGPVIRTSDGGSAFAGFVHRCQIIDVTEECSGTNDNDKPFVAKLDRDGNKVWFTKMQSDNFWNVISLIELPKDHGYIGLGQGTTITHPLFKLDKNGLDVNSSSINSTDDVYKIQAAPDGFLAFAINGSMNSIIDISSYTDEGNKTKTTVLENITNTEAPSYHDLTIATRDDSYFSINVNGSSIHAQKLDSNGKPVWDRQVISYTTDMALVHICKLIETNDGGCLIVLGVEKQKSCHSTGLTDIMEYFWKMIIESRIQRS
jgi:hypothetical protein